MKAIVATVFALGLLGASVTAADALTIHIGTHHWHHRHCWGWGWHHHHRYCRGWRY
ncbi:MAG TPA: hypothetical protein VMJ73_03730 [Rhizomicrobium sp.]|nr:hypothetical protein [Rhizomicrobium sp.]